MSKFVVYEKVAELAYSTLFDKEKTSDVMQTTINLGSGLIAGFTAAIVSQPADTMLSKINQPKGLPGESTASRLIKIAKELGFRGSYSGIGARLFMVGVLTAGQFAIYGTCVGCVEYSMMMLTRFCRRPEKGHGSCRLPCSSLDSAANVPRSEG